MLSWRAPISIFETPCFDFGIPQLDFVEIVTVFKFVSCAQTLQESLSITMAKPKMGDLMKTFGQIVLSMSFFVRKTSKLPVHSFPKSFNT